MSKKEFAQLAMALRTYYPRENLLPNDQALALWYEQLKDLDYKAAEAALGKWVATNKWPPTIAEIRETAAEITHGAAPDWGDGWEQVLRAIRKFGMYNVAGAMESLDDITRQCVERLGFKEICMSENIAVDRANFRMIYEQIAQRRKTEQQVPPALTDIIKMIRAELSGETKQIEGGSE